jgi:hypothetical protein
VLVSLLAIAHRADAFVPGWAWLIYADASPRHGWAWQVQRSQLPSLGAFSGVPSGEFAVAWFGQPDKIAYLGIGGVGLEALRATDLVLAVDPDAPNASIETADIRACLILSEWEPTEPIAWDVKPTTLCDRAVEGVYDGEAGAFRFKLTALGEGLSSPDVQGISIEPAESPAEGFQVIFEGVRLEVQARAEARAARGPRAPIHGEAEAPAAAEPYAATSVRPSSDETALSVASAPPTEAPRTSRGRPVSMSGVYAALAALAVVLLVGRALAGGVFTSRDTER